MPHHDIDDTHDQNVVPDTDTEEQILTARIIRWTDRNGYAQRAKNLLAAIGLGDRIPDSETRFTVDLSAYISSLPNKADLSLIATDGHPDDYDLRHALDGILHDHHRDFTDGVYTGAVVAQLAPREHDPVDVEAVIDAWGEYSQPYPQTGSDDIQARRQQLVDELLEHGEKLRFCDELERAIREIGLSEYLPPDEKEVTATGIPGFGNITVPVPLHRGKFTQDDLQAAVRTFITAALDRHGDIEYVAPDSNSGEAADGQILPPRQLTTLVIPST